MLSIYSIFQSVEGECNARGIGAMTTFIRFAGCTANCKFCDTTYAKPFDSGKVMTIADIMKTISEIGCTNVTITGGEPMEQYVGLTALLRALSDNGYNVSVETNGLHPLIVYTYPENTATWVVDMKNTGPVFMSRYCNMQLTQKDIIKMVIGNRTEFMEAIQRKYDLQLRGVKARFAFSPEYGVITPDTLLSWMKEYKQMDSILSVQLHKILGLTEAN